jgi:hypothetical protein
VPEFDKIEILPHAQRRLSERNVLEADATSTICNPDKKTVQDRGSHGGKVYLHSKKIGDAKLFVVAEVVARSAFIITAFWEYDKEP